MAWDIDLLVEAVTVRRAGEVLQAAGYRCSRPHGGVAVLDRWSAHHKDSEWYNAERRVYVELHTSLVEQPRLLANLDPFAAIDEVQISAGLQLPTLGEEAQFAYLCAHGALSGWRRLKWLADLAALLAHKPPERISALHDRAVALGGGRTAGQALLLLRDYLDLPVPDDMVFDRTTRWLARQAAGMMTAADAFDNPSETRLGTLPIHVMDLLLVPGSRYFLAEATRQIMQPWHRFAAS